MGRNAVAKKEGSAYKRAHRADWAGILDVVVWLAGTIPIQGRATWGAGGPSDRPAQGSAAHFWCGPGLGVDPRLLLWAEGRISLTDVPAPVLTGISAATIE